MRRIVLATATYRTLEFEYVRGLTDLLTLTDPAMKERLRALDVEIVPASARGYGSGVNFGGLLVGAIEAGAELVLTIDSDIAWTPEHVAMAIESRDALLSPKFGKSEVVVGAVYPQSKNPSQQILCEIRDGARLPQHDGAPSQELAERFRVADELRGPEGAGDGRRYARVWLLPTGFVLWPTSPYRFCAGQVEERMSATKRQYFDATMSEIAMAAGAELVADLALDVGHMSLAPVRSRERLAELAAMERGGFFDGRR